MIVVSLKVWYNLLHRKYINKRGYRHGSESSMLHWILQNRNVMLTTTFL